MNEIIQRLMQQTGLPEDKAAAAVSVVVGFLKQKLPGPIAAQLDGLVSGSAGGATEDAGGVAKGLSGLLGKQ